MRSSGALGGVEEITRTFGLPEHVFIAKTDGYTFGHKSARWARELERRGEARPGGPRIYSHATRRIDSHLSSPSPAPEPTDAPIPAPGGLLHTAPPGGRSALTESAVAQLVNAYDGVPRVPFLFGFSHVNTAVYLDPELG